MTTSITYAERTQIIKDWATQFPEMGIERKRMLLRKRIGPLLMEVMVYPYCSTSPYYNSAFTIYGLYRIPKEITKLSYELNDMLVWKSNNISDADYLDEMHTLNTQKKLLINSNFNFVKYLPHYNDYLKWSAEIKQNAAIKASGPISLEDIWRGYEKFLDKMFSWESKVLSMIPFEINYTPYRVLPIYTAIWAGENDKAKEYLKFLESWNSTYSMCSSTFRTPLSDWQKRDGFGKTLKEWQENILYYMDHPDELRQIVKEEVIKHKLEKVPYQNIVGVKYQE